MCLYTIIFLPKSLTSVLFCHNKKGETKKGKKFNIFGNFISNFFTTNEFFKKNDVQQTQFLEI